ncbi:MAG: hypothetical protein WDZ52_14010 [Pseudohongiellaceae bacterium]
MLTSIRQTHTLCLLFAATIALAIGFQIAAPAAGGILLDGIASLAAAQELLQSMSMEQKQAHFWITLLLDMPFPFAYGGLFLGLCLRHGGKYAPGLATPAFLVIPVDLIENAVQLMALAGNEQLLPAKELLTPAKFLLFYLAALIALGSLGIRLMMTVARQLRR